jgi:hypothetical protein
VAGSADDKARQGKQAGGGTRVRTMWAGGHAGGEGGMMERASERARATGGRRPGPASQPLLSSLLWFAFFGSSAVVGVAVGVWWCWPEAKLARRQSIYSRHAHGTRMRQPGLPASACQRRDDVTSSAPVWASGPNFLHFDPSSEKNSRLDPRKF